MSSSLLLPSPRVFRARFCAAPAFFCAAVLLASQPVLRARDGRPLPLPPPGAKPLAPVVSQFVPLPKGAESDWFARRAESLPIVAGPVRAAAWVLMDAGSGRVLAGRNVDQKMFPASTTKTMTALLAVESGKMEQEFSIGPNPPHTGEASVYLQAGEKFVLRDLVKAALIRSANDSCVAIAEAVAGSTGAFVKRMNARAKALGAIHTHFANPHGLHNAQHFTTPRDLALIARRAMSLPAFAGIASTREDRIHGNLKVGPVRLLLNRNRLLFRWNGCEGVKTGYTRQAGHCLIASSTRTAPDGRPWRLISVVMRSPDPWSDGYNVLVHEGFEKFSPQVLAPANQPFALSRGEQPVPLKLAREVRVALRTGEQALPRIVPERAGRPDIALVRGERVAHVEWSVGGKAVARAPLFATLDVPADPDAASQLAASAPGAQAGRQIQRGLEQNRILIVLALLLGALGMALAAVRAARPPA